MITEIHYKKTTSGNINLSWKYNLTINELDELHPGTAKEILKLLVESQIGHNPQKTQQIIKYIKSKR